VSITHPMSFAVLLVGAVPFANPVECVGSMVYVVFAA
jgi:hypothetical protein